jgi:hypothetical protein
MFRGYQYYMKTMIQKSIIPNGLITIEQFIFDANAGKQLS